MDPLFNVELNLGCETCCAFGLWREMYIGSGLREGIEAEVSRVRVGWACLVACPLLLHVEEYQSVQGVGDVHLCMSAKTSLRL